MAVPLSIVNITWLGCFRRKGRGRHYTKGLIWVTGSSEMEFFKGTQTPMLESVLFKADRAAALVPWEEAGPTQGGSVLQTASAAFKGCCQGFLKSL